MDGVEGQWYARENSYDAIVLDIMLPCLNGYELCARLREEGNWTPILMLTAKVGSDNEARALDTGADDFLAKPFSYAVLMARIRALLRRGSSERPSVLVAGDLRLDPASHVVSRAGNPIELTPRQFSLLEFLLRRADQGWGAVGSVRARTTVLACAVVASTLVRGLRACSPPSSIH